MNKIESNFISCIVPAAQAAQRRCRVPASVTIAQAILESSRPPLKGEAPGSGWGRSELAEKFHNFFGIKWSQSHLDQPYVELNTTEYANGIKKIEAARFVWYGTVEDSFEAHAWLLANSPTYAAAMRALPSVPGFCLALQECGYSTNRPPLAPHPPYYADVLMDLIDSYGLMQYDVAPGPDEPAKIAGAREAAA